MDIAKNTIIIALATASLALCHGCKFVERSARAEVHECIDARIHAEVPKIIDERAMNTTQKGLKALLGEYGFHGISGLLAALGLGGGAIYRNKYVISKKNGKPKE